MATIENLSFSNSLDETIDRHMLREVLQHINVHALANFSFCNLVLLLTIKLVPTNILVLWEISTLFLTFAIIVPLAIHFRKNFYNHSVIYWERLFITVAIIVSAHYAILPWFFFPHFTPIFVVTFTVAFVMSLPIATTIFVTNLKLSMTLILGICTPFLIYSLTRWDFNPMLGRGLVPWSLFLIAYVFFAAKNVHHTKRNALKLQLELDQANRAKSRLMTVASHDLRQPLHALGLHVDYLNKRLQKSEHFELLNNITESVQNLNKLIEWLFDITKIESGNIEVHKQNFSLNEMLLRLTSELRPLALRRNLTLRRIDTSIAVNSDPVLIELVIRNLVANAIRYTQNGKVLLGCRRRPNGFVEVQVVDTGRGIPETELSNIFNEFYQVDIEGPRDSHSLGLGLYFVKRLCMLLNHEIQVHSIFNQGSTFGLLLPVTQQQPPVETNHKPVIFSPSPNTKVVVIDDDLATLQGMERLLVEWGYEALCGDSITKVLALLKDKGKAPDLIISDYHLEDGTTGIDAIAQLRKIFATDITGIIITGDTRLYKDSLEMSAVAVVHKPLNPIQLRSIVQRLLAMNSEKCG